MERGSWAAADSIVRRVLDEHAGVARINAFLAAGLTRYQIAAIYRRGELDRPRNAWYSDPALPWQAKVAVRVGGTATCMSLLDALHLPVPPERRKTVHVSVEENDAHFRHHSDKTWKVAAGDDELARMHWARRVDPVQGWRCSLVDALLHAAGCMPEDWFVAALDAVLHEPKDGSALLSRVEFIRFVQHLPRRCRRLLRRVDPRAESPIETLLRLGLVRRGIGPFDLQVWTHPMHRVDIVVRGRLILEADGEAFHDPVKDAIRDALMRRLGYTVLRFSYERIVFDLEAVLDEIEAALAALAH